MERFGPCFLASFFMTFTACQTSFAQEAKSYYEYHPDSILHLGACFDASNLSEPKLPAFTFVPEELDSGAPTTSFSLQIARNTSELRASLHIDESVEADMLFMSGTSHTNLDASTFLANNQLAIVLTATAEYSRVALKNISVTAPDGDIDGSKSSSILKYGTHFVSLERRGATISIIFEVEKSDFENAFNVSIGGSGGFDLGIASGSASANLSAKLTTLSKNGNLSIKLFATGGEGISGLSDLFKGTLNLTNPNNQSIDATNIEEALRSYFKTLGKQNSVALGYFVTPLKALASNGGNTEVPKPLPGPILENFQKAKRAIEILGRERHALENPLNGDSDLVAGIKTGKNLEKVDAAIAKITNYIDTLKSSYKQCSTKDPNYLAQLVSSASPNGLTKSELASFRSKTHLAEITPLDHFEDYCREITPGIDLPLILGILTNTISDTSVGSNFVSSATPSLSVAPSSSDERASIIVTGIGLDTAVLIFKSATGLQKDQGSYYILQEYDLTDPIVMSPYAIASPAAADKQIKFDHVNPDDYAFAIENIKIPVNSLGARIGELFGSEAESARPTVTLSRTKFHAYMPSGSGAGEVLIVIKNCLGGTITKKIAAISWLDTSHVPSITVTYSLE